MGTKRVGLARMQALLENLKRELNLNGSTLQGIGGYSSTDQWGNVRPSFIPGIDRGVRSVAIGQMHGYGFEDLADLPADGQTTSIWLREDENSAAIALSANDADFTDGSMTLTPGSGANDKCGFMTANQPFACTVGKKFWVETSFKIADINDCEMFFGLIEDEYNNGVLYSTVAAGAGADKIGFKKGTHSSGAFTTTASLNTTEETGAGITVTADNDVVSLGIMWDGVDTIKFYGAFAATGTEVGDLDEVASLVITPDQNMSLLLEYIHTTAAADDALVVNYVRGAWEV